MDVAPPFAAEIREGRLYGRGTADNKAGIACGLYTLALLRDRGEPDGLKTKKRGPKINLQAEANEKLRRENERLRVRLQQGVSRAGRAPEQRVPGAPGVAVCVNSPSHHRQ